MSCPKSLTVLLLAAFSSITAPGQLALAQVAQYDPQTQAQYAQPSQPYAPDGGYANPQPYADGAFNQQQYQQPAQQYGGDPGAQYGQQQPSTYYGYAADAQQTAPPQQYRPAPQPVYGQQGPPAQQPGQPANLKQFLDKSDQQKSEAQAPTGPGMGSKIMSGAGTLAKVAGTVAAGYMMSKAINKQTKAMQQMPGQMNGYPGGGYPGGGYPGGGYPGGGYPGGGYPGGGYPYPGGGYPYPTNNYPMGANMAGSSMMGATVMNGLNALLMNH